MPARPTATTRRTPRLRLRHWRDDDREPFAAMNADPEVMRYFPSALDATESFAFLERIAAHLRDNDWGLWAVDIADPAHPELAGFAGMVGIWLPAIGPWLANTIPSLTEPVVEVGWRLVPRAWGYGYATEAASEALRIGFEQLDVDRIVSFTSTTNDRSRAVMERIGMTELVGGDFDHPAIAATHPLCRHVLYVAAAPT